MASHGSAALHALLEDAYHPFRHSYLVRESHLGAGTACTHTAQEICCILRLYRRYFTPWYINATAVAVVMAAAEVHVHGCCTVSGQKGKSLRKSLSSAFKLLEKWNNPSIAIFVVWMSSPLSGVEESQVSEKIGR